MQVFISYSHIDDALAEKVAAALEAAGFDAWYDKREIIPGENWAEKIAQGLRESNAMIVLLTPHALESDRVRMDIDFALCENAYSHRLIPVFVGDPEDFPTYKIPWIFSHLKTVNLPKNGKNDEQLKRITDAIKEVA